MKLLVFLIVFGVLHIYSIEAKERRSRKRKSCQELKEICIKRKLYHFQKRYKSKTICLKKYEPVIHSSNSTTEYYVDAKRKTCDGKGGVKVPRKCVQYAKEKPLDGLELISVNQSCTSSSITSYYKKRLQFQIRASKICSSKRRIRHTKCGEFRFGGLKNSTTKDERKYLLDSISTSKYTHNNLHVPNTTTPTPASWSDLPENSTQLDGKNGSTESSEPDGSINDIELFARVLMFIAIPVMIIVMSIICCELRRAIRRRRSNIIKNTNSLMADNIISDSGITKTSVRQNKLDKKLLKKDKPSPMFLKKEECIISLSSLQTETILDESSFVNSPLLTIPGCGEMTKCAKDVSKAELDPQSDELSQLKSRDTPILHNSVQDDPNTRKIPWDNITKEEKTEKEVPRKKSVSTRNLLSRLFRRCKPHDLPTCRTIYSNDRINKLSSEEDKESGYSNSNSPVTASFLYKDCNFLKVRLGSDDLADEQQSSFEVTAVQEVQDVSQEPLLSNENKTDIHNNSIITIMLPDTHASASDDCFDDLFCTDCDVVFDAVQPVNNGSINTSTMVSEAGEPEEYFDDLPSTDCNASSVVLDASEPGDVFDDLYSGSGSEAWLNDLNDSDTSQQTNNRIISKPAPNDVSADTSMLIHDNTAVESSPNDVRWLSKSLEKRTSVSIQSFALSLSLEPTWIDDYITILRKTSSEPDSMYASLTDIGHFRRRNRKWTDCIETFQPRSIIDQCDEMNFSSFDSLYSAEEDIVTTFNIRSCLIPNTRAHLENTPLPSELSGQTYSSGSSTSTHIYLGDTSHLGVEEGGENDQEEREQHKEWEEKNIQIGNENDQNDAENDQEDPEEDVMEEKQNEEDKEGPIRENNNKSMTSKPKNPIAAIKNNLSESVQTAVGKPLFLDKDTNQRDQNDIRSYYQDGGTQTKSQNLPRTIFNTDWTAAASFDFHGGELQTENSSVKLIVTQDTVNESESITINAHVHVTIKKLTEVLKIPKDEFIVSPAPEYHLNADWKKVIKKPMIILLPVVLPTTFITEHLRIYGFQSAAGVVVKYSIEEKSKLNDNDQETYFEVSEDRKNILIYTYHFSGVVACYKCSKTVLVPGYLNARIKGSNTPQKNGRKVRIRYEIFVEKNGIKDFKEPNQCKNVHNGLVLIEKKLRVNLPAAVDNESKMIIKLNVIGDEKLWQCKKLSSGEEIFPLEKEVYIKDMITCSAHNDPFCTEWVMCGTSKEPLQPFECMISVYEKDADETEGAVAISSPNKHYVELNDQLGIETVAWSSTNKSQDDEGMIDPVIKVENIREPLLGRMVQETQPNYWRNLQPTIDSLEIRSVNRSRSMPELFNGDYGIEHGIKEVGSSRQASYQRDLRESTDGPQAMAELDLTNHRLPCENTDSTEYPVYTDQQQTKPKEHC